MSRAFVKENDDAVTALPDRPISAHPNLVTEAGLRAIERAVAQFEAAGRAALDRGDRQAATNAQRELRYWRARRGTAQVVQPASDKEKVHFGAAITLQRDDGRRQTFRIVGEDEAEPARGSVSHVSPLGRALLGREVGEIVNVAGGEATITTIE
jgi:transcription elongation GreA/GreB family factor